MKKPIKTLPRTFWQRLCGSCATPAADSSAWRYEHSTLTVNLELLPELTSPGNALRFEGNNLPQRVLVICGDDRSCHAVHNRCTHMGRRLDFVPGTKTVQCCSISKSTWEFNGTPLHGQGRRKLTTFPVEQDGNVLRVLLSS